MLLSFLSSSSFLFKFLASLGFEGRCSYSDGGSPERSVLCDVFPVVEVDVTLLHVGFQDILVAFLLTSSYPFAFFELGVEDLFREAIVTHPDNVAAPS